MQPSSELRIGGRHPRDSPGLPRGRSRLPEAQVREAQNTRLVRATISVVAAKSYAATTVADIVGGARVSRREFYDHFADKEECFLAAARYGESVLLTRFQETVRDAAPADALRACIHAYLALSASEPEFTRCLAVELRAAGEHGLRLHTAASERLARILRDRHEVMRRAHPDWPPAPPVVYVAAVGAIAELVVAQVSAGAVERLPELEDDVMDVLCRLFAMPMASR